MKLLKCHIFKLDNSPNKQGDIQVTKEIKAFSVEHAWEIFINHMNPKLLEAWVYDGIKGEKDKPKKVS